MNAAENKESMFTLTRQVYLLAYICITCQRIHLQCGRSGFDPWVGNIPWRRKQQPIPVFLPREFHRQKSLLG